MLQRRVGVSVVAYFVSLRNEPAHEIGVLPSPGADDEERRVHPVLGEHVEESRRALGVGTVVERQRYRRGAPARTASADGWHPGRSAPIHEHATGDRRGRKLLDRLSYKAHECPFLVAGERLFAGSARPWAEGASISANAISVHLARVDVLAMPWYCGLLVFACVEDVDARRDGDWDGGGMTAVGAAAGRGRPS
jgi:hypothetical protein